MLGVDPLSTSPISSSGTGRFIHVSAFDNLAMATFEGVLDEDGVLVTNLINVFDAVRVFRDWEGIDTGDVANWSKFNVGGNAGWEAKDVPSEAHWTKIQATGSSQWGSVDSSAPVDWQDMADMKRNRKKS